MMITLHSRLIPVVLRLAPPLTFTMGCADGSVEEESATGATPVSGAPLFCLNQYSSSLFACAHESDCLEMITMPPDLDALRAECVDDGGRVLSRCSETGVRVLGACNEGDRLRVFFDGNDASQERMGCEEDGFEWVSCP